MLLHPPAPTSQPRQLAATTDGIARPSTNGEQSVDADGSTTCQACGTAFAQRRLTWVAPLFLRDDNWGADQAWTAIGPALYVQRQLSALPVSVTRIARGLPVGGDLEYADGVTIAQALTARREMR